MYTCACMLVHMCARVSPAWLNMCFTTIPSHVGIHCFPKMTLFPHLCSVLNKEMALLVWWVGGWVNMCIRGWVGGWTCVCVSMCKLDGVYFDPQVHCTSCHTFR